jgi:catechol 2,3-dioxygenase-like lactoylglutathione lyase family enzyme
MIDHLTIQVREYAKSRDFYLRALAPLGYALVMELSREQVPSLSAPHFCGLGVAGKPDFWLRESSTPTTPTHLAFAAKTRDLVDEFYRAALAAGAKPNGDPGLRPEYHPSYYGAFVIDLNGHNLEAVCHGPV